MRLLHFSPSRETGSHWSNVKLLPVYPRDEFFKAVFPLALWLVLFILINVASIINKYIFQCLLYLLINCNQSIIWPIKICELTCLCKKNLLLRMRQSCSMLLFTRSRESEREGGERKKKGEKRLSSSSSSHPSSSAKMSAQVSRCFTSNFSQIRCYGHWERFLETTSWWVTYSC